MREASDLQIIELESDFGPVLVQAVHVDGRPSSGAEDIADLGPERLGVALGQLTAMTNTLAATVADAELASVEAELAMQFVVKSGKVVAAFVEAGGECSVRLTLRWEKQKA